MASHHELQSDRSKGHALNFRHRRFFQRFKVLLHHQPKALQGVGTKEEERMVKRLVQRCTASVVFFILLSLALHGLHDQRAAMPGPLPPAQPPVFPCRWRH